MLRKYCGFENRNVGCTGRSRGDIRIYFYNIKQAWVWSLEDLKWLSLASAGMNPAVLNTASEQDSSHAATSEHLDSPDVPVTLYHMHQNDRAHDASERELCATGQKGIAAD